MCLSVAHRATERLAFLKVPVVAVAVNLQESDTKISKRWFFSSQKSKSYKQNLQNLYISDLYNL